MQSKNCVGQFQMRENKKTNHKLVKKCLIYTVFCGATRNKFFIPLIMSAL